MSDGPTTIGALSFCNKCNKQFELTEFHKPGICLSCHGILKDQRFLQDEETLELAVATALRDSFGFEHDRVIGPTSKWRLHARNVIAAYESVSRKGNVVSPGATAPDANLAGPEGDTRPDHFNVHMHDWHGEADGIGYSCSSCSAHMTESGQISRPR